MAHGLGAVPHVIFVKSRSGAADSDGDWNVYHHKNTSAPETDFLILNETTATQDAANRWNDTIQGRRGRRFWLRSRILYPLPRQNLGRNSLERKEPTQPQGQRCKDHSRIPTEADI